MLTAAERYRGSFYPGFATQATSLPGVFDGRERVSSALLTDFHIRYAFRSGISLSLLGRNVFNQRPLQWRLPEETDLDTGRDFFLQASYDFGGKGR
jgi:outer membrane receptor protein involved in Fe transport